MTLADKLSAEFTNGEVRQFTGRAGQTFDYIEDETVMDRLDEVLGIGSWSIHVEPISVADGIVKVQLEAIVDGKGVIFEDFGYASNAGPNAEGLKEAVSDGIRRCGRFLGVGRYLYKKHPQPRTPSRAPAGPPSSQVRPARSTTDVPDEPLDEWDAPQPIRKPVAASNGAGWTFGQLAQAAEDKGIAKVEIYRTADQLFGPKTKVTDLEPGQREQIAFEMGLVG